MWSPFKRGGRLMKINEFIKDVHKIDKSLNVYQYPNSMWITYKARTFVKIPFDAKTIFDCRINDEIDDLTEGIKISVSNKINRFIATPLDERFPEKRYRLRWLDDKDGTPEYIDFDSNAGWNMWGDKNATDTFTESQLDQLKRDHPLFASVIDIMKELVEEEE